MVPNDNEVRGKLDKVAGNVKERVGRATGDVALENEGADQRIGGSIEDGVGKARRKIGEGLKDLGRKLNE